MDMGGKKAVVGGKRETLESSVRLNFIKSNLLRKYTQLGSLTLHKISPNENKVCGKTTAMNESFRASTHGQSRLHVFTSVSVTAAKRQKERASIPIKSERKQYLKATWANKRVIEGGTTC